MPVLSAYLSSFYLFVKYFFGRYNFFVQIMFTSFGSSWVSRCGTVNCVRVDRVTVTVNICFFLFCSIADLGVCSLHPAPVMWQVWSFHMGQVFQVLKVLLLLQVPHIWQVLIHLRTFTSIDFLSFKWNGSLYIYPWSTQLLTYSLTHLLTDLST